MNSSIFTFDSITRALRIGAFSGLAVTLYAVFTDSHWLLEGKYFIKATQKSLQERDELKQRYKEALENGIKKEF